MNDSVRKYSSEVGKESEQGSQCALDSETPRTVDRLRDARRAYKQFYASCFWSFDPEYKITIDDIPWIAKQLMKNGGRAAWEVGAKLCR